MVTFVAIGDFGTGTKEQHKVSKALKEIYDQFKFSFVIGLGDNIYPSGCSDVKDKLFIKLFEDPYSELPDSVRWYMCLGNHDYGYIYYNNSKIEFLDNSQCQIEYTKHSKKWYMPSRYYSFVKGPIEFFYLDTNLDRMNKDDIEKQLHTMKNKLDTSKATWKVVCGHHTWESIAYHGSEECFIDKFLKRLFKDTKPDYYMCGHDHCKSIITKNDITLLISGNGGEVYNEKTNVNQIKGTLEYFSPSLGFALINATNDNFIIDIYGLQGNKIIKEYSFHH